MVQRDSQRPAHAPAPPQSANASSPVQRQAQVVAGDYAAQAQALAPAAVQRTEAPDAARLSAIQRALGGDSPDTAHAHAAPVQRDVVADINTATTAAERDDAQLRTIFQSLERQTYPALVATVTAVRAHLQALITLGAGIAAPALLTRLAVAGGTNAFLATLARGTYTWVASAAEADAVIAAVNACGGGYAAGMNFPNHFHGNQSLAAIAGRASAASQTLVAGWFAARPGPAREPGIKGWFDAAPNSAIGVLQAAAASYFGLSVGEFTQDRRGQAWDAAGLRRVWPVLEALPPRDVNMVDVLGRYQAGRGEVTGLGGRSGGTDVVAVGYDARANIAGGNMTEGQMVQRGDPLYGRNRFDTTVRHEVGHVVAASMSFESGHASGANFGGWRTYSGWSQAAQEMLTAMGDRTRAMLRTRTDLRDDMGPIANTDAWFLDVVASALEGARTDFATSMAGEFAFWGQLTPAEQTVMTADPLFSAVRKACGGGWTRDDGGDTVGDRKYNVTDSHEVFSYLAAARARKVSKYQMKSPGEWFAEAYATYYDPTGGPARLQGRDPATKAWFDTSVNGR